MMYHIKQTQDKERKESKGIKNTIKKPEQTVSEVFSIVTETIQTSFFHSLVLDQIHLCNTKKCITDWGMYLRITSWKYEMHALTLKD